MTYTEEQAEADFEALAAEIKRERKKLQKLVTRLNHLGILKEEDVIEVNA